MRKLAIALTAFAVVGIALPPTSSARAEEEKVVIKRGDHDRDWRRHHDWRRDHAEKKVVIIKHRRHHDHDTY